MTVIDRIRSLLLREEVDEDGDSDADDRKPGEDIDEDGLQDAEEETENGTNHTEGSADDGPEAGDELGENEREGGALGNGSVSVVAGVRIGEPPSNAFHEGASPLDKLLDRTDPVLVVLDHQGYGLELSLGFGPGYFPSRRRGDEPRPHPRPHLGRGLLGRVGEVELRGGGVVAGHVAGLMLLT